MYRESVLGNNIYHDNYAEEVPLMAVFHTENESSCEPLVDEKDIIKTSANIAESPQPSSKSQLSEVKKSVTSIYESAASKTSSLKNPRMLNTLLLEAIKYANVLEVKRLLDAGANPNATCHTEFISACHIAALHDNEILSTLLQRGANKYSADRLGRTPLHIAAWAGNLCPLLALLGLPEDLRKKLENGETTTDKILNIRKLCNVKASTTDLLILRCHRNINAEFPSDILDNTSHSCKHIYLPNLQRGCTPLHAAASAARLHCCMMLLAVGADPHTLDDNGRTPFDIAGSYYLYKPLLKESKANDHHFKETIKLFFIISDSKRFVKKNVFLQTPLHTAVELENVEVIDLMLQSGFSLTHMNEAGLTPLHLCVKKKIERLFKAFLGYASERKIIKQLIDACNRDGYSVLHYAVLNQWATGVSICLEAGANAIFMSNNGETPMHTAAALGNSYILEEILNYIPAKAIDISNENGESALFKAVLAGQTESVKLMLQAGALIHVTLPEELNVFHVAAKLGHTDTLRMLLDYDNEFTKNKVNTLSLDQKGFGPIHYAVENNHVECVKLLLSKNAFVDLKTTDGKLQALHIAARQNNVEISKVILETDASTIHNVDITGNTPLHIACSCASKEVISFLISKGADLSARTTGPKKDRKTVIEVMMESMTRPTELLESILDTSIYKQLNAQECNEEFVVDFRILLPDNDKTNYYFKSTVIEALIKSGKTFGQRRLLQHPLMESFLCIKWKALQPFYYTLLCLYGLYLLTLTIFVMTHFGFIDGKSNLTWNDLQGSVWNEMPSIWNTSVWSYILYTTIILVFLQVLLFMTSRIKYYMQSAYTWSNILVLIMAAALPFLIKTMNNEKIGDTVSPTEVEIPTTVDIVRYIATGGILLSWMQMSIFLSLLPQWGTCVIMFDKFFIHMLKVVFIFAFLVIGYTLTFMLQFHHREPFKNFFSAFIKTMIMMISEFDTSLITNEDFEIMSLGIIRIVYLIFMIFTAIVVVNMMVGIAVSDLQDVENRCHIKRLEMQVACLACLDSFIVKRVLLKLLSKGMQHAIECKQIIFSKPATSYNKDIPPKVRNAIFNIALNNKEIHQNTNNIEKVEYLLGEIRKDVHKYDNTAVLKTLNKLEKMCKYHVSMQRISRTRENNGVGKESRMSI